MEQQQQTQQQWLVDFGQKVDLTARLREILLNYPEGTSILKELVQNADDAKATTVRFVLDHTHYAADSLLSPQLAEFQGPALLAYNDGIFTEKDFESISRIGDSKKREQAGKTGRFGVGFNSVYHLTDVPGFVSGEHLVFFDPHCKYLPAISAANPGKKINFVNHPVNSKLADQVAPFHFFGCDTRQPFQGTLFRFPLRTQQQADASTISKQVYTPAAISALFDALKDEAALILLFLKSVRTIEVLELAAGQQQPQLLFSCSVANATSEVLQQRAMFTAAVAAPPEQQVSGTFKLGLVSRHAAAGVDRQQTFLISQRRGPPQLLAMASDLSKQFQVPLIAWGAVAADVTPGGDDADAAAGGTEVVAPGRAFCFLPLPALTSLPVHINGFFELSSNRRDVWHGSDMAGAGRLRAQWNEALLQLVVAPAYLELLAAAAKLLGPRASFNRLWPSCDAPEPWQGVVRQLYGHLPGKQLLWTAAEGGQWLSIQQCMFPDAACLQQQQPDIPAVAIDQATTGSAAGGGGGAGAGGVDSSSSSSSSRFGPLGEALVQLGLPLAVLPGAVLAMMARYLPELPQTCSPAAARRAVKSHADRIPQLDRQQQLVPLLGYCLRDLDLSSGPAGGWLQDVQGLRLLPLADGSSLATFSACVGPAGVQQPPVFVVTDGLELSLVDSQRALLLDHELVGAALSTQLSLLASFDSCNLKHLTMQHLVSTFLPRILPQDWRQQPVVAWSAPVEVAGDAAPAVTWEWLQSLWQWLAAHRQPLEPLTASGWPLLPVLGSQLVPLRPLQQSPVVLPGADTWPTGLAEVLGKLGVHVLDADGFELPLEMLKGHCVHSASGPGVAAAIAAAMKQRSCQQHQQVSAQQPEQQQDDTAALSADERRLLRSFLLQPTWFAGPGSAAPVLLLRSVARQLPLYELANSSTLQQQHQRQQHIGEEGAEGAVEPVFVNLEGSCFLAPAGISRGALSSSYVLAGSQQEAAVMVRHLSLEAPSAAHVYRSDILPKLATLPQPVRDTAMLLMLRHLPDLQQQDRGFAQLLAQTPFLPSGSGQLHVPSDLYDPRVPELVALLDPDACFPAPAFCGDVSGEPGHLDDEQQQQQRGGAGSGGGGGGGFSSLAVLQQLGLRSSAQLDTLVQAALYVEKVAADGDEDMAVARGKALLAFLNTESERLVGRHTAITSAAAAAMAAATSGHSRSSSSSSGVADADGPGTPRSGAQHQRKPNRPGQGLFRAMQRGLIGLGTKLQGGGDRAEGSGGGATGSSGQQQDGDSSDGPSAAQVIAQQWLQLSQLRWCPLLVDPPDSALPWRSLSSNSSAVSKAGAAGGHQVERLAAPCAVRLMRDLWLVSAVKSVVDGECQSQVALSGLGWCTPLAGAELGSQLAALGQKHRHVPDGHLAQQLARIVPQLYMAIDDLPPTELAAAAAVLDGQPSVWVGNGFVDASRVAFRGGMDLSPHLYVLPLELTPFLEVLSALGAQEAFSAAQYTTVLQDLADEAGGKPLQPKQLAQALGVAQALADVLGASGGGATAGKKAVSGSMAAAEGSLSGITSSSSSGKPPSSDVVLVPDEDGVMRPAADLAFDDAPWLDDGPSQGVDGELKLVHSRIAAPVAEALGVASRRRLLLAASADCFALGLAGAGGAVEAFGQSEALTTRLRHIIQDYPEGPGVLLELVQNADDAGATKAAFLLDMRQHGTSWLLGPGMAAWQGPALLAYNNAIFSPGDFAAIASIGQDGKMSQPAAIGRFGLGFNSVYHLTDLPSFVSGQHLVLFDPHACYLPGASAAQPGLRVNLQRGRLLQQFPDAFSPYRHFGCSMEGSFPGTLFRFPLRSDTTAATSNIKAQPTSPQQALALLQSLSDVLPQALLFLKSLREVEVYVVGDAAAGTAAAATSGHQQQQLVRAASAGQDAAAADGPRLLFRASLKPLDGKESLQQPITKFVSAGGGGSGAQQLDAFFRRLESARESELPCSMGRVQLSLSVATQPPPPSAHTLQPQLDGDQQQQQQQQLVEFVGSSSSSSAGGLTKVVREDWLVCNQLGGGSARAMAIEAWRKEKVKMIPWVGVAAQLATHIPSEGGNDAEGGSSSDGGGRSLSCRSSTGGRAFCFLPLPADTNLPVHINGYFELSSNRRDVWHGDDMAGAGQRRARWNEALLDSAVAAAYAALIQEAARVLGPSPGFWRLLPLGQGSVPEPWVRVAAALYARLVALPVLHSPVEGGRWLAPQQVLLPDAACCAADSNLGSSGKVAVVGSEASVSTAAAAAEGGTVADAQSAAPDLSQLGFVPAPLRASLLASLLVQCGVPLVMGLSHEQQRCMLQWSPKVYQITPALTRRLLQAQPALVADTLARHQRQQDQEQATTDQPAAAVILHYCLSDAAAASSSPARTSSSSSSASPGGPAQQQQPGGRDAAAQQQQQQLQLSQALQQLNGLRLLPLADGELQAIHVSTTPAGARSSSRHAEAPVECTVYVTTSQHEQQLLNNGLKCYMLHERVGAPLQQQLQLLANAGVSNLNVLDVKCFDAHVLGLLLPSEWHSSRGHTEVAWQPQPEEGSGGDADVTQAETAAGSTTASTAAAQGGVIAAEGVSRTVQDVVVQRQPSEEFIRLCWQWLAHRSDAADVCHWPLLPVTGGKLRLLQQPAQVLRAGDWTEQLMSALTKLGCCLLDTRIINFPCPALEGFVQQPTAAGLLDALAAAQAVAAAKQAQMMAVSQHGHTARGAGVLAGWQQQLRQLTGAERHHLRTYLLQARWFAQPASGSNSRGDAGSAAATAGAFTQQQLQVLRSLPIYEVHPPLPYEETTPTSSSSSSSQLTQQQQADVGLLGLVRSNATGAGGAGGTAVDAGAGLYRSLAGPASQQQQQLLLPPAGISNGRVLGSQFLTCESGAEEGVLAKHLGIPRVSMQEFLMLHLAKAPTQLEPRALISTIAHIISRLKDLSAAEPDLLLSIKVLPLIPTRAGSSSSGSSNNTAASQQQQLQRQQLVLAAPCELFDPSNATLVQLLDARHFPAAPFDGSAAAVDSNSSSALAAGGSSGFDGRVLLEGLALCGLRTQLDLEVLVVAAQDIADAPPDDPAAYARAQLLLHHLDQWAQQRPLQQQQPDSSSQQDAEHWKRLQTLQWCPVLVSPPEAGLPWPHIHPQHQQQQQQELQPGHGGAGVSEAAAEEQGDEVALQLQTPPSPQQQRVWRAAPKMTAPAEMAWLVSGPLRLLAAPCPSKQLLQRLGWMQQQVLRPFTASMQLVQLGDAYPAGTVDSPQLQAKLAAAASALYSSLAPHVQDDDQLQLLRTNLLGSACMWVGTGFAFPAVTALQAPDAAAAPAAASSPSRLSSSAAADSAAAGGAASDFAALLQQQGLLYLIPQQLQEQQDGPAVLTTLRALHVHRHWGFAAYAIALAVLGERSAGRALTEPSELDLALQLADAAAAAQSAGSNSLRQLQEDYIQVAANVLKIEAAGPAGVSGTGGPDLLVLPDAEGVLAAPSELYFNDAAWLGAEGLRLAHASLRQDTAEALGVRSMRWQHQASEGMTKAIHCPSVDAAAAAAATVISTCQPQQPQHDGPAAAAAAAHQPTDTDTAASLIGAQRLSEAASGPALAALLSILKWADSFAGGASASGSSRQVPASGHNRRSSGGSGSSGLLEAGVGGSSVSGAGAGGQQQRGGPGLSFSVVLDERQHGTQSLLHSGLSRLQGPALCVVIGGISSLPADKLAQLLALTGSSASSGAAFGASGRGSAAAAPAGGGGACGGGGGGAAAVLQGLASVWAVTDVVQAMSGDTTCYWDPSGQALAQTVKEMRQQAPRGRSVNHTQPELAQRFAHQWQVWDACRHAHHASCGSSSGSSSWSGDVPFVGDALYLRLPLRLQDHKLQSGSAIATAAGARLGISGRSVGLSLEDVRQQVAAFGPAAARSLLFLGHLERVSVATWPANSPAAVQVWQASLGTQASIGGGRMRVGTVVQPLLAKYRDRSSHSGAGNLLARLASGARSLQVGGGGGGGAGGSSGHKLTHRDCWPMALHTEYQPHALQQLRAGQQELLGDTVGASDAGSTDAHASALVDGQEAGGSSSSEGSDAVEDTAADPAQIQLQVGSEEQQQQQQQSPAEVRRDSYNWFVSLACEVSPPSEAAVAGAAPSAAAAAAAADPILNLASVAVCTACSNSNSSSSNKANTGSGSSSSASRSGILPVSGAFCGVALPGTGGCFGQQLFLIDVQGSGAAAAYGSALPAQQQQAPPAAAGPAAGGGAAIAAGSAVARRRSSDGQQLDVTARQAMAVLVSAWHELLVSLRGTQQQLYVLMPDLLAAMDAGDRAAAYAFKQMYQDAASMPIWQLHSGACVHIQEGAFLPPKAPASPAPDITAPSSSSSTAAGAAASAAGEAAAGSVVRRGPPSPNQQAGLGEEAREFIMQQLPLFQVPWPVVAQLEAASVSSLRIISPAVLRPLLRAQQPKGPNQVHPFVTLTATQALQLLEYCCSDLTAHDDRRTSSGSSDGGGGSSSSGREGSNTGAGSEGGSQAAAAGGVAAAEAPQLPPNLPQGVADAVADVFGPQGLALLGGLATQMQQRLVTGLDDVLNLVADAMVAPDGQNQQPAAANRPQQQQQQQQPQGGRPAPQAVSAGDAVESSSGGDSAAASAVSPVNLSKVAYLRGLPIPTAGGTVAILGVASLFVFDPQCSPAPTSLMPAHLLRSFVLPECLRALSWLLQYPEVREQLRLTYYGLPQLAAHLSAALGPTWSFTDTTAATAAGASASTSPRPPANPPYGGEMRLQPSSKPAAACMPGTPGFPAVVAWDDGAAGGPYVEWLGGLWRVILHTIAVTPDWQRSIMAGAAAAGGGAGRQVSSGVGGGSSGNSSNAAAGMADGIRSAAQRARGLAEVIAGEVAQALNVPGPVASAAAAAAFGGGSAQAAATTAEQDEAEQLWRPLQDWPLLPLADGRLLKLRYRELALAVVPEYKQAGRTGGAGSSSSTIEPEVMALQEPWDWLLPALCAAGQPLLDPRFSFLIDPAAASPSWPATAASAPGAGGSAASATTAAAAEQPSSGPAAAVPALPVHMLLGAQPLIGRPPFLGPLVKKLAATQHTLGGLDWSGGHNRPLQQLSAGLRVETGPWDTQRWTQLFTLLADHPPRDLQPDGIAFLRELPMFRLVAQPQSEQQGVGVARARGGGGGDDGGDAAGGGQQQQQQLVALGTSTDWVLAPASVMQACSRLRALPSLPAFSTDRVLEHRPGWGELYDLLGVEPASLAQLLHVLLLPHLPALSAADRLAALEFIRAHWTQSWQYSGPLSTVTSFAAALKDVPLIPAAQPSSAPASAALVADNSGSSSGGSTGMQAQEQEQLYRPAQLFDPSVPLFAAVLATMAAAGAAAQAGMSSSAAAAGGGAARVLFPAPPFTDDAWIRFLRDLGLQHKVTKETFLQLAQHVAQQAAALSQDSDRVGASAASSSSSTSASRLVGGGGSSSVSEAGCIDVTGADPAQFQKVQAAADALLGHLKSHWTGLGQDRAFWQAVAGVQFWPASRGVPGSRQARQVFASATSVALHSDWPLVWSVQPLLDAGRVPAQTLRQQLGMRSPPPLSAILLHLQTVGKDGGEELLASWPDGVEPFNSVTLSVLQHLDKEGLSPQQAMQLTGAAFIPVAHASRLVSPQQLFLRLGGAALAPFAFEVPGQFAAHAALLRLVGVRDEPRVEDLVNALWRFGGQLSGRRMNPNELAACIRLLSYLCSRAVSSADASFLSSARRSNKILVPTAGAQLLPAARVVSMGGAGGSMTAARLLGRTDPRHLVLAHPQLPEHVCRWLGVPALSDCLVEELDQSASDLSPLEAIGGIQLPHLRSLLSSPAFAAAAFSIAAAHATAVPALRQLDLGSVTRLCAAAGQGGRLRFVQRLATRVVLRDSREDVTRDSASRQVFEFFEQASNSAAMGTLYVAEPPPGLPLSALLAQVLSRALGCPFTLPLHPLLEVRDAAQLAQLQPMLHAGGYDGELEGALAAGHVGAPLQPADKALLRLRPLRHYEAGELVAVKRRLTAALPGQAAAAAAEARAGGDQPGAAAAAGRGGGDAEDGSGMVLCYGRVAVDAAPQPGQAAYRLSVEVSPGVYESMLSTQVFCFQSGAQHTQPAATATDAATAPEAGAAAAAAGSSSIVGGGQATGPGSSDAPGQQASELTSAVADMLSAAGVPLDLDTQKLLQQTLAANAQLQQASAAVAELRQEAARKESELEALRCSWQCRVCFSRDVEQAFVGCGHMYCAQCMPSLPRCPVCRKPSQKIKLFR